MLRIFSLPLTAWRTTCVLCLLVSHALLVFADYIDHAYDVCGSSGTIRQYNDPGQSVPFDLGHNTQLGSAIVNLGDLNLDGHEDIAVGDWHYGNTREGVIFIKFMPDEATSGINTVVWDVSYLDATLPGWCPDPTCQHLGSALANLGDVDDDGVIDIASSLPMKYISPAQNAGRVIIFYLNSDGSPHSTSMIDMAVGGLAEALPSDAMPLNAPGFSYHFGRSIADLGDLDGDGTRDMVVGMSGAENGVDGGYHGGIFIIYLQTSGVIVKSASKIANSPVMDGIEPDVEDVIPDRGGFGSAIANMGDINGDSIVDLAVGASNSPQNDLYTDLDEGCVIIVCLTLQGTASHLSYIEGPQREKAWFGESLAAYDINADGMMDLIVGQPEGNNFRASSLDLEGPSGPGSIMFIYLNTDFTVLAERRVSTDGNSDFPAPTLTEGESVKDHFGSSLALYGDSILVGAEQAWNQNDYLNGVDEGGRFYLMPIFHCDCTGTEYIGAICDIPCENGGMNYQGSYVQCDCTNTNAKGATCSDMCVSGSVSQAQYDWSRCDCTGTNHIAPTCDKSCYNGVADEETFTTCNCTGSGASGKYCTKDENDCVSSPCIHGGTCVDNGDIWFPAHNNEFNCSCDGTGYHGDTCGISDCASNPCLNGGMCNHTYGLEGPVQCNCSNTGYEGDWCQTEIDECASSPCVNDGVCTDLLGDFTCECTGTGYEGLTCTEDVDDCASSPCVNDGLCQDKGTNKFKCTCDSRWEGDTCSNNVDDCLLTVKECLNGGACTDDPVNLGDVICDCSTSTGDFTGDYCDVPIEDACVTFNPCFHGGKCILDDMTKEMSCDCADTGYEGDVCDVLVYVSECVSSPCLNEGQCYDPSNQQDDWYCECTNGYFGDLCDTTACDSNPCQNEGTCINSLDEGYTCSCLDNYSGNQCQRNEDEQVGLETSSSSDNGAGAGAGAGDSDTDNDNKSAQDGDDGSTVAIIIVIIVVFAAGIGGFVAYKHRQSAKSFTMPV